MDARSYGMSVVWMAVAKDTGKELETIPNAAVMIKSTIGLELILYSRKTIY